MKKSICFLVFVLLMGCCTGVAQPILQVMEAFPFLKIGEDWTLNYTASEGGTLSVQLMGKDGSLENVGAVSIEAGEGSLLWDGQRADDSSVEPGRYTMILQIQNFWGEVSEPAYAEVEIQDGEERESLDLSALEAQDAQVWEGEVLSESEIADALPIEEPISDAAENGKKPVPKAESYWDMDPDAYDLTDPDHQQAIWEIMMQPITVVDVGQTEHVYPTNQPGIDRKPYETNCAGEIHGQSQGVKVLEDDADGDGYVLIQAYSNDGTKTDNEYMESIDNKLIQGYVKKGLLFQQTPSRKYGLLIDKLRQKLYIFEEGRIIGSLYVSTGLNNPQQPYNETPAGEFVTISRVGEFNSGTMRSQFAIRINGGTLLHEVPFRYGADGKTKFYDEFESEIGKKASHACIRVQRIKNAEGQNMAWLWNHLEGKTKVLIWDDTGRKMFEPELPDAALQLYRNPNGGSNYHLNANCSGVKSKFLPLAGDFTYGDLMSDDFKKLTPCMYCGAPERPETLYERYVAEANVIGAALPDNIREKFGLE